MSFPGCGASSLGTLIDFFQSRKVLSVERGRGAAEVPPLSIGVGVELIRGVSVK